MRIKKLSIVEIVIVGLFFWLMWALGKAAKKRGKDKDDDFPGGAV